MAKAARCPDIAGTHSSCFLLLGAVNGFADTTDADNATVSPVFEVQSLFQPGDDGYHCSLIPALLVTNRGTILAFAEARKVKCNDCRDVDLAVKRSADHGKTKSEREILADASSENMKTRCVCENPLCLTVQGFRC